MVMKKMVSKLFGLEEKHVELIKQIKEEQCFKSESETLRYILEQYEQSVKKENQEDEFIEKFLNAYQKKYYTLFERLRWASQTSEKNTTMLLDAINTMLIMNDMNDGVLVEAFTSPVLEMSQTSYKEKIAHFKQMKDDRKRKREEENKNVP